MFNIYVDDLTVSLEHSANGCYVSGNFLGCIMYADDLLLLSASVSGLQNMLDICYSYGVDNYITFNHKKSVCVMLGYNRPKSVAHLYLGNMRLAWADSLKYLGIMFSAGTALSVNTSYIKRKFYMACDGILGYCHSLTEFVKLGLVRAFCLPLLTYCVGALDLTVSCIRELAICWNDSFRKIFGYRRHESVKLLQYYCSELPFEYICDLNKWKYMSNTATVPARIAPLYYFKSRIIYNMSLKYGFYNCAASMKRAVFDYFASVITS